MQKDWRTTVPDMNVNLQVNLLDNFIKDATRTESRDIPAITARFSTRRDVRLLHAAMGAVTESAELMDAIKAHLFYGRPIDIVNVFEESGDLLWYLAILFDEMQWNFEVVTAAVIAKLRKRYPDKFDDVLANNRDLNAERRTLESTITLDEADALRRGTTLKQIEESVDKVMVKRCKHNHPVGKNRTCTQCETEAGERCPRCGSKDRAERRMVMSDSSLYDERECGDQWHMSPSAITSTVPAPEDCPVCSLKVSGVQYICGHRASYERPGASPMPWDNQRIRESVAAMFANSLERVTLDELEVPLNNLFRNYTLVLKQV